MAQYVVPNPNDVFFCPFEESHTIRALGAIKHLHKCAKSHPNMKLSICPFNQIHWVKQEEFAHHVNKCPDKSRFQLSREQEQYIEKSNIYRDPVEDDHVFEEGEDWTHEMDSDNVEDFCWNTHVASSARWAQPHEGPVIVPTVPPKARSIGSLIHEVPIRRANASFKLSPHFPSNVSTDSAVTLLQMNRGRGTSSSVQKPSGGQKIFS
ncbi:hypothetical protein CAPTEDRAFT_209871 [Capitella teleta]|uniref:CHHC U11-48K-type domain-containing protein n=1 Tax=Capitella teleta TaxID=283909 RepID=R7UP66_CAPTE|nr:hypothetical protein CAPTEDRAFT_209871 [Capitella teleta]|eukprot:ELU07903.1 hypothetical protein CAPTEDRAFT_209871 [Capitella teleta]